jgi:ParB family chromosome partitioning protein
MISKIALCAPSLVCLKIDEPLESHSVAGILTFPIAKAQGVDYSRAFMAKVALGKGLGALINTRVASPHPAEEAGERIQNVRLSDIIPTPLQPRTEFRDEGLHELVESIRERGIIQPLIVRRKGDSLELIAGERRWRAATKVGLDQAPVIIREATDQEVLELALVENLQREDLNPIEEAKAFDRLAKEFGLKQEEIARKVGKSRAAVANSMRLLDLTPNVCVFLKKGQLTVGHAKVLLSVKAQNEQELLADQIIRSGATVREAEKIVAKHFARQQFGAGMSKSGRNASPSLPVLNPALRHVHNRLQEHLATRVTLQDSGKRGKIEIEFYGADDLNRLLDALGVQID